MVLVVLFFICGVVKIMCLTEMALWGQRGGLAGKDTSTKLDNLRCSLRVHVEEGEPIPMSCSLTSTRVLWACLGSPPSTQNKYIILMKKLYLEFRTSPGIVYAPSRCVARPRSVG